jgi:hypothetical protein
MASLIAKIELRNQIKAVIGPWKSSTGKPPYSPTELITIALIADGPILDSREIMRWIAKAFAYYEAVYRLYDDPNELPNAMKSPWAESLRMELHSGFYKLEAPFHHITLYFSLYTRWRVSWEHARVSLQGALGFEPRGTFPFLRLPPELRDKIYKIVLCYPGSGLSLKAPSKDREPEFEADNKFFGARFSIGAWLNARGRASTYSEPAQQTLSLLLVNKQIFQESFLHFYENNIFYCSNMESLGRFLRNLPLYRRQHLTQLAFDYSRPWDDLKLAPRAFKFLASLPNLRKLYIHFEEGWSLLPPLPPDRHDRHKAEILETLGISTLRTVRGLEEVVFNGDCPVLKETLKSVMESPVSKKRKSTAVEVEGWGRPIRAVRLKKVQKT